MEKLNISDTIEKWDNIGFLDGLGKQKQENVALAFELAAIKLIEETSDKYSEIETITFPIIRRIFQEIEFALDVKTIEENVSNIINNLRMDYKIYLKNVKNHSFEELGSIDPEAEFCTSFSKAYILVL